MGWVGTEVRDWTGDERRWEMKSVKWIVINREERRRNRIASKGERSYMKLGKRKFQMKTLTRMEKRYLGLCRLHQTHKEEKQSESYRKDSGSIFISRLPLGSFVLFLYLKEALRWKSHLQKWPGFSLKHVFSRRETVEPRGELTSLPPCCTQIFCLFREER